MATQLSLKLLVDKNRNKVLFAESGKDFVDFLFSLMNLPVGTIVRLLTPNQTTTGCIGNLYSSIDNLDNLYIQPNVDKSLLLQPKIGSCGSEMHMLLMQSEGKDNGKSQSDEPKKTTYYRCKYYDPCMNYVTNMLGTSCPHCGGTMTTQLNFVEGQGSTVANGGRCGVGGGGIGYVKEVATYMITDDLEVKPMSAISSITILNKCGVKDIGALEDRVVHLGTKEGLDLLRASLQSKSVLTDVFLEKWIKVEPCTEPRTRSTK